MIKVRIVPAGNLGGKEGTGVRIEGRWNEELD